MPEGHVIHRAARRIAAALLDQPLADVQARGPDLKLARTEERLVGQRLVEADPRGKVLLLHFSGGWSLLSHLRMDGAWHLYRTGERWRRPGRAAWVVLDSGAWQAVNFNGPVLELHPTDLVLRDRRVTELGPDVLVEPFDDDEYLRRMRLQGWREVGDAVMQQRIVAGIGNIYKAESLFMASIDPWRKVDDLTDDELLRIRRIASKIMLDGVLDQRVITFGGPGRPGQWVYGRTGMPCRRCGRSIRAREQGDELRITWWCEHCQT